MQSYEYSMLHIISAMLYKVSFILISNVIFYIYWCFSASFYGDSFLFERHSDFLTSTSVSLRFQTQASSGLILLVAGEEDYLIISLKDGSIVVSCKN